MYNINSGYIGSSRSIRSQEAIDSYEIPISMINKAIINKFLNDNHEVFSKDEKDFLKKISVAKWKFLGKERELATSWHHTSSYFNETDHYSLSCIAEELIEAKETLDEEFRSYQSQMKAKSNVRYGVIKVQVWGGTRNRPKLEGYEEVAGIKIGDWLYYKYKHSINSSINKFKITANKVEWFKEYDSYNDLIKNHKEYKGTRRVFNKLIIEKNIN